MDEEELSRALVSKARETGSAALVALGDVVLAAHGIPPVSAVGLATADTVIHAARVAARRATGVFGSTLEMAAGTNLATTLARIADDDRASQLVAALNALVDRPSEQRAILLGAILGESVNDELANEQEALDVVLEVALAMNVAHIRLLAAFDRERGDLQAPGLAFVERAWIVRSLPGFEEVLDGLIAACVANGTLVQRQAEGLTAGPTLLQSWSITSLGAVVVEFLHRYTPDRSED